MPMTIAVTMMAGNQSWKVTLPWKGTGFPKITRVATDTVSSVPPMISSMVRRRFS